MKYFPIALLLLSLAFTGCAMVASPAEYAQDNAEVESGKSTIIVSTDMEAMEAYRKANEVLQDEGFTVTSSDSDLLILSTDHQKNYAGTWGYELADVAVNISVRETEQGADVRVTGTTPSGAIESGGQSRSPRNATFQSLVHVAQQIGDSLSFE